MATASKQADSWTPTRYSAEVKMTGEHITLCTSARSGDGKFRFIWRLAPGKRGPHEHVHTDDSEVLVVVSGTLRMWLDGIARDVGAGEVVVIPRGARHRFLNPTKVPVVVRVEYDGTQMEDTFAPVAVRCHPNKPGARAMARMLVHLLEKQPSIPTSKWELRMMSAIARVLRLLGVKAHEPVYGWDTAS